MTIRQAFAFCAAICLIVFCFVGHKFFGIEFMIYFTGFTSMFLWLVCGYLFTIGMK